MPSEIYLCAVTTDSFTSPSTSLTSGPGTYVLVPPLSSYVTNDESMVNVDSSPASCTPTPSTCITLTLTDYVAGGTTPYSYYWYSPSTSQITSCTAPGTGTPSDTYDWTVPITGSAKNVIYYGAVFVTDSTSPGSASTECELYTIIVEPAFSATFNIDGLTGISGQTGSPAFEAVVAITGGSPWYGVTIYSGTDSNCPLDMTVVASQNDINATESILPFPEPSTPSSTTYYCAVVTDSTGNSVTSGPIQVDTSPALSTPTLVISPPTTSTPPVISSISATVSWAGGNAPYYVVLTSGSSSSCAAPDNAPVTPTSVTGGTAQSAILPPVTPGTWQYLVDAYIAGHYSVYTTTGVTIGFTLPVPSSTTYYCAIVFDSSTPTASQTYTPAGVEFTIEPILAAEPVALSSNLVEQLVPQYEGATLTATVTWSGGTGPFDVTFYSETGSATSCPAFGASGTTLVPVSPGSNPQTGIAGSPPGTSKTTFSFVAPNNPLLSPYYYCAQITDIATGATVTTLVPASLSVAAYLGSSTIGLTSSTIDIGQVETLTISATWAGGNAPYTATLTSGSSMSCASDTSSVSVTAPSVNPAVVVTGSVSFSFTSPTVAGPTYYCVTITDSSSPASVDVQGPVSFTEVAPPTVTIGTVAPVEAGTSVVLAATGTGGVPPYTYQWFIGSTCAAADAITSPSSSNTYNTGVITTSTTYSVLLMDSSTGTPASIGTSCATVTVSVADGPLGIAAFSTGPSAGLVYSTCTSPQSYNALCVIDSDSNSFITTIPLTAIGLGGYPLYPSGVAVMPCPTGSVCGPSYPDGLVYVSGTYYIGTTPYGALCYVSPATNTELGCQPLGANTDPEGVASNPITDQVFVALNGANEVAVNTIGVGITAIVPVGAGPEGVAVDLNNYNVFVSDNTGNTVSIMQPVAPYYLETSTLGWTVTTATVGNEPVGVAFDPVSGNVWVANSGSGTVYVLSGSTYNLVQMIKVGGNPAGISISDANNVALVTNEATNTVTPVSLTTFAPGTPITVGSTPFGIANFLSGIAGIPSLAYVTNSGSNTVSVINLATDTVIATIVLPS